MHNDEFEPHDKGSHDQHKYYRHHRKNSGDDDNHPHNRARDRQRTTAIALSVITCLFMCVIGYEIIRENSPKHDDNHQRIALDDHPRPSLMLSKLSLHDDNEQYSYGDGDEDSYENHQIRMLQEQNRRQAGKIKALRQELLEKMQAMHEIKANLFKQEGDPRDKAKIEDLSQRLEEKEKTSLQLTASMKTLELELAALHKKIEHSEVTREALAAMIESHRASKEQALATAQKQIEDLKQSSLDEISGLQATIKDMEATLQQLDSVYREKVEALDKINQELAAQYELYQAKSKEHDDLADLHKETRESMSRQILDLIASLEWEAASKARVTQQLQEQLENQHTEKSAIIGLLEAELIKRNERIASLEDEENRHRNELGWTAGQSQDQILNLITTLEFEMTRTSFLQQDLDRAIYTHKLKLADKSEEISDLEIELKKQQAILDSKGEELENMMSVLSVTQENHRNKLSDLVALYELEKARTNQLTAELDKQNEEIEKHKKDRSDLLTAHADHWNARTYYQNENDQLSQQLNDQARWQNAAPPLGRLATKSAATDDKVHNIQIDELEDTIADLREELTVKELLLATGRMELHTLMEVAAASREALQEQAVALAHQIELGNTQIAVILNNSDAEKSELEDRIASLNRSLSDIEISNTHLAALLTHAHSSNEQLENKIAFLNQALSEKENQLADNEEELRQSYDSKEDADHTHRSHYQNLVVQLDDTNSELGDTRQQLDEALKYKELHEESQQKLADAKDQLDNALKYKELHDESLDKLAEVQRNLNDAMKYKDLHQDNLQQIADLHQLAEAFKAELDNKEQLFAVSQEEIKRLYVEQSQREDTLKTNIHALSDALEYERQKLVSLEKELESAYASHAQLNDQSAEANQKLQEASKQAVQLEELVKTYQNSLASKEKEINALIDSKSSIEKSLSEQINDLHAQVAQEKFKTETLQRKFQERSIAYDEQSQHLQNFELQVGLLSKQLMDKQSELLAAEDKLLLTLPQVDALTTENQHLHQTHSELEEKLQKTAALIHQQQRELEELAQKLDKEQSRFEHTVSRQEEYRRLAQQAERKAEHSALRAHLLEEQLTLREAALTNYEDELRALVQANVVLKDDYDMQVAEIEKSHSSKNDDYENKIVQLQSQLEAEKQKNKAIQADLKKVITAYNHDKQRLLEAEKNQAKAVAERDHSPEN